MTKRPFDQAAQIRRPAKGRLADKGKDALTVRRNAALTPLA